MDCVPTVSACIVRCPDCSLLLSLVYQTISAKGASHSESRTQFAPNQRVEYDNSRCVVKAAHSPFCACLSMLLASRFACAQVALFANLAPH